jgi:hypothetical protein
MSTTLSIPRPASRRNQIVASATGLAAAGTVAIALALGGGGDGQAAAPQPSAKPATAQPNSVTQYRNESVLPSGPARRAGTGAADRFHHFR